MSAYDRYITVDRDTYNIEELSTRIVPEINVKNLRLKDVAMKLHRAKKMHFLGFNLKNISEGDMRNAIINGLRQFSGILALRLRHFDGIESPLRDLSHIIGGLTVVEMRNSIKGYLSN